MAGPATNRIGSGSRLCQLKEFHTLVYVSCPHRRDEDHSDRLKRKGISVGKGVICYFSPTPIELGVVGRILLATWRSIGPVC